jgi:hypothetical protein
MAEILADHRKFSRAYASLGIAEDATATRASALFDGRRGVEEVDPTLGNAAMIAATRKVNEGTLATTRDGTRALEEVRTTLQHATTRVLEDNEKLRAAEDTLTEIDTETAIASRVALNMLKRVYTDKIILAFVALILLAIVGIAIYAAAVPSQQQFNIPDVAKPPTPACIEKQANGQSC